MRLLYSSKSAAAGAANRCDPWEFSSGARKLTKSLPVGAVLTISAAGSEMSNSCVITNEDGWLKRGFGSDLNRPIFALMNPELTYTVSKYQTACGITDISIEDGVICVETEDCSVYPVEREQWENVKYTFNEHKNNYQQNHKTEVILHHWEKQ